MFCARTGVERPYLPQQPSFEVRLRMQRTHHGPIPEAVCRCDPKVRETSRKPLTGWNHARGLGSECPSPRVGDGRVCLRMGACGSREDGSGQTCTRADEGCMRAVCRVPVSPSRRVSAAEEVEDGERRWEGRPYGGRINPSHFTNDGGGVTRLQTDVGVPERRSPSVLDVIVSETETDGGSE
jgi:hypothetical protein